MADLTAAHTPVFRSVVDQCVEAWVKDPNRETTAPARVVQFRSDDTTQTIAGLPSELAPRIAQSWADTTKADVEYQDEDNAWVTVNPTNNPR